jgi:UDPglucose 6-dehydrogenase
MLAARISFMNEMTILCEHYGADIEDIRKGIGSDSRIGPAFLRAGCGYGGSCFPKDVKALVATARNHGLDFALLAAVDAVNDRQKRLLAQKARAHFAPAGGVRGRKVAVWGLAFKPKTDDIRAAPSLALIEELLADGAVISAHDPVAMPSARRQLGDRIQYAANPYAAVEGAEALFLVTEWNEFRQPDFARVKQLMAKPVVFDGRNIWNPQRLADLGFTYYAVGRGAARSRSRDPADRR